MSQENVEVIHTSVEHINRTGEPAWDLFDPEITFTTRGDIESSTTYEGHQGLRQVVARFAGVWESVRWEIRRCSATAIRSWSPSASISAVRAAGSTSRPTRHRACWMRDGKYARIEQHGELQDALEAVGLTE